MKIEDLVALLDSYTAAGGYYIKPKIDGGAHSFLTAKGPDATAAVRESLDASGTRDSKPAPVFTGEERVECAICCHVPNLADTDRA